MRYLISFCLVAALAAPAMAGPSVALIDSRSHYSEPEIIGATDTTADVTQRRTRNTDVVLQGRVIKSEGSDFGYYLQDNTGSIALDIDDHLLGNFVLTPENVIRIRGTLNNMPSGEQIVNAEVVELLR